MIRISFLIMLLFILSACGTKYKAGKKPQLSLYANDEVLQSISGTDHPDTPYDERKTAKWTFGDIKAGHTSVSVEIIIGNLGGMDLIIDDISLNEGGNPYISLVPSFSAADFPITIKPDDALNWPSFNVVYAPKEPPVEGDSVLVLECNDYDRCPFTIIFSPMVNIPLIQVDPPAYTFINATHGKPQEQEFTISNIGLAPLEIFSVQLKTPSAEFNILNMPKKGTVIDPDGKVKFKVRYQPVDEVSDSNIIVIKSNDPSHGEYEVPIAGELKMGLLEFSYEDQLLGYLDFTNVLVGSCTKVITAYNKGEGPVTIQQPQLSPPSATSNYIVKLYKGGGYQQVSCGEYIGEVIDPKQHPVYGLGVAKSVDVVVTYTAPGAKGLNAIVVLPYQNPYPGKFEVPAYGGAPKGGFDIAPANYRLSFFALPGETKVKTAVIMNTGNGELLIRKVWVEKVWQESPVSFYLLTEVAENTTIPPFSLLPLKVQMKTDNEDVKPAGYLKVLYKDPLTYADTTEIINLDGAKNIEGVTLPTAHCGGTYSGKAGEPLLLNGMGSKGGTEDIYIGGYLWFISEKPANSKVFLNIQDESKITFTPDVPGKYRVHLTVFTDKSAYFSDEVSCEINVQ